MPDAPKIQSPAEMRALADQLDKDGDAMKARAVLLRRAAAAVDALSADENSSRLTSDVDSTNLHGVNASTSSAKLARGMSRSRTKKHPFVKALYEKERITVTEWAKRNGYKSGTVSAWVAKPDAAMARRIPREAADKIEKQLGVPATLATWRNGITEPE